MSFIDLSKKANRLCPLSNTEKLPMSCFNTYIGNSKFWSANIGILRYSVKAIFASRILCSGIEGAVRLLFIDAVTAGLRLEKLPSRNKETKLIERTIKAATRRIFFIFCLRYSGQPAI